MDYNIPTEPAASSSSPSTRQWEYDVFLSFRGADTRFSVVDRLYSSLLNRGIATFWDDDQLQKEGDIPREIFEAIEKSRISVVVFSENYASSTRCLDELAKILECKKSQQQVVLPIFYDVDPSYVRKQKGTFAEAFVEHESRFKDDEEKVKGWRAALTEIANLSGFVFNKDRHESKFIDEFTEDISRQLNHFYLTHEMNYPVGIDSHIREMNDLWNSWNRLSHGVDFTYQVKELESDEALELFSSNAFPTSRLPDDYQALASSLVGYAQGNPLILKDMGSFLYGKSIEVWLSVLERVKTAPASYIPRSSYFMNRHFQNLTTLDLSKSKVQHIPKEVGKIPSLRRLDLTSLNLGNLNLTSLKGLRSVSFAMPKAHKSEADDVDGVNATETNKGSPGGDATSPDTPKKDQLGVVTSRANVRLSKRRIQLSNNMAYNITTEPAASSSSPSTHQWKYDVFLNFRGADTRVSVVDPLYSSLLNRGIDTFWDDDQLKKGGDIPREIFEAIEKSRISVVIFSENYASSTWCLDELAKILECRKSQQQILLPIYYYMDPSDVRNQRGTFAEAFVEHEDRFKDDEEEKVLRWRSALTEAATLSGMVLNKDRRESNFIHEITEMILQKLNHAYLRYETNYPVGIDSRIREMNDLLGVGAADVRMVGILGNGGMGKTTLATAVYNSVAHKFEGSCFLGDVAKKRSQQLGGLVKLQKTLLHDILGVKISSLTNDDSGVDIIRRSLRDKRVLLIIDDVDDLNQLKRLAGSSDWFGAGSRIIITTRFEHLLLDHKVDFTYQVKELEPDEAMELFHSKAFPTSRIPNDYLELANRLVGYARGNPSALTAVGSLLDGKSKLVWHSILKSCETAPALNIHEFLKITKQTIIEDEREYAERRERLLAVNRLRGLYEVGSSDESEADDVDELVFGISESVSMGDLQSTTLIEDEGVYAERRERRLAGLVKKVKSPEMPKADKSEADNVDGAKATKTNKGSPGGDENSPDSHKKDQVVDVTLTANVRLSERRIELSNNMDDNITTEPAASSSSPSTREWKYDVFLSFRGADTRVSFAGHLHDSLLNRGINTFMDDDELEGGEFISRALLEAIEDSRISVIVFSENYASSRWCLDELVKILECKKSQQQIVLPIYYDADPSHVRHQTGTFGEAFRGLAYKYKDDEEKVMRWRMALTEAGNLSAMVFNKDGHESKFILEITEQISRLLKRAYLPYETYYLVGIDSRIREINDLLSVGVADVRTVGIWGIGGMGKTTLAKAVYNSVAHKFEGSCFLGNVRENSKAPGGLVQLQNTLLHKILGPEISRVTNVDSGVNIIKSELRHKRVLLIIDDVDQLDPLKYLAGSSDWFGAGSRIIITTRVEHFLLVHRLVFTYQVKELEPDDAMELFSSNAFPTSRLPDDYQVLASSLVGYAQGNPLALTAMGSLLYGKRIDQWHCILESYKRAPASNIHEILKITKKELEHDLQSTTLNKAESPEKLVEDEEDQRGPNEAGSLEMSEADKSKADDVDGVNATETNKSSPGGKNRLIQHLGDATPPEPPELADNDTSDPKGFSKWIFLIIALILEIISVICDHYSSSEKPEFAVIGVVCAILAVVICVFEVIYKCRKRKFEFGRCRMCLWWFFCPQTDRLFGTWPDLLGLFGGIYQCVSSIVQCVYVFHQRKDNPFKVNLLPIIILLCVGGSNLFKDCKRCTKYRGSRSLGRNTPAENPDSGERTMSLDLTPVEGSVEGGTVSVPSNLSTQPSSIRRRVGNSNEISGEEAFGSVGDENHLLAGDISSYVLSTRAPI